MTTITSSRVEQIKQAVSRKLVQIGKEDTPANRENVAAFLGYRNDWKKIAADEKKALQNARLLSDRESRRTDNHSAQDLLIGQQWAKRNNQVIGNAPGQISIEFAITTGRAEHDAEVAEIEAAKAEGLRRQTKYEAGERQRIDRLYKRPYDGKHAGLLEHVGKMDDEKADELATYSMVDLANAVNFARSQAEDGLLTKFTPEEASKIKAFLFINELSLVSEASWSAGFAVLKSEGAIRAEALPTHKVVFVEPTLPTVESESSEPKCPHPYGSPEAKAWERERLQEGRDAERYPVLREVLTEIATASYKDIPPEAIQTIANDLDQRQLLWSRSNIRMCFFKRFHSEVPSIENVFTPEERQAWDVEDDRLSSSELRKKYRLR